MTEYVLPRGIDQDMGGDDVHLDERMRDVLRLLEYAPYQHAETVLDIGMGKGQVARWFADKGKRVTGTGIEMASYSVDTDAMNARNICLVECFIEKMPFSDESFDCVVMSHVLEHCGNVALALAEVRRVLKRTGWLLIFLPPADDHVCAGHVSVGWSVGQLMYVLLINRFAIKNGHFIEYGYNVCGYVQKTDTDLPPLRMDRGDISILQDRFPLPIKSNNASNDGYFARITSINWPAKIFDERPRRLRTARLVNTICRIIPGDFRLYLATKLITISRILQHSALINPRALRQ